MEHASSVLNLFLPGMKMLRLLTKFRLFFTSSDLIMYLMLIIFVKNLFKVKGNMFLYG